MTFNFRKGVFVVTKKETKNVIFFERREPSF